MKSHSYSVKIEWTGNKGSGTFDYRSYSRNHVVSGINKTAAILGSSDPNFLGDTKRYNPEELFVSSLASCHMLWYLHLCAINDIIVMEYIDEAHGTLAENKDGSGQFTEVELRPKVFVTEERMIENAIKLHTEAAQMCFIANSCNFPIRHTPNISVKV
jgi:organic hydroperoxide reductase OsmC/OhrA